jgi:hypothetical protein
VGEIRDLGREERNMNEVLKDLERKKKKTPEDELLVLLLKSEEPLLIAGDKLDLEGLLQGGRGLFWVTTILAPTPFDGYILARALVDFFERNLHLRLDAKGEEIIRRISGRIWPGTPVEIRFEDNDANIMFL